MRQLEFCARSIMIAFRPFGRRGSYHFANGGSKAGRGRGRDPRRGRGLGCVYGKGVCNPVTALLQLAICCCSALILISTALVLARHPFPLNHKTPSSFRTTGDARVDCEDQRRRYTSCYVVCAAPSTGRSLKASSHYDVGEGVRYCKIGDGKCPPRHPRKASPALDDPRDDL